MKPLTSDAQRRALDAEKAHAEHPDCSVYIRDYRGDGSRRLDALAARYRADLRAFHAAWLAEHADHLKINIHASVRDARPSL